MLIDHKTEIQVVSDRGPLALFVNVREQGLCHRMILVNLPCHTTKAASENRNLTSIMHRDNVFLGASLKDIKGSLVAGLVCEERKINSIVSHQRVGVGTFSCGKSMRFALFDIARQGDNIEVGEDFENGVLHLVVIARAICIIKQ